MAFSLNSWIYNKKVYLPIYTRYINMIQTCEHQQCLKTMLLLYLTYYRIRKHQCHQHNKIWFDVYVVFTKQVWLRCKKKQAQ